MITGKLQLTNGYPVNFDQLARFVTAIERDGRARIPVLDLALALDIAERNAENVGSMARAFGLANARTYTLTALAKVIQTHDRFFDDIGTLWFLHYVVASEPTHLIWNRIATEIVPLARPFSREELKLVFSDFQQSYSVQSATTHVTKELTSFLNAYTESSLSRLQYLMPIDDAFQMSYREPVPPLVLAACITRFRDKNRPADTAISVGDLLTAGNSPGVICQITEDRLRLSLEALRSQPGFSLESRADLDQVRLTDASPDYEWMERYYASRD